MIASLLSRRFWIPAYIALAAGIWLPGHYAVLRPAIPFTLGGILFFTSLKIRLGQVAGAMGTPRAIARLGGLSAVKLLVLPIATTALVALIDPVWAPGVALIAMMPAGMASSALTDLYQGNLALALMMILLTSILCPITVPILLRAVGAGALGNGGWLPLVNQAGYIVLLLCTPFVLAQMVRALVPAFVEKHQERWGYASIFCMCLLVFLAVAVNRPAWSHSSPGTLLEPLALSCLASALAVGTGLISRCVLSGPDAIAFSCNCIYMNNGLGIAFADHFFHDDVRMILPSVLMQVPMLGAVALVGRWSQKREAARSISR